AELQKRFPFPVDLENDSIAAAIGEWQFGAGTGLDNLVYVTVSTCIGGGVVSDGRVVRGRRGKALRSARPTCAQHGLPCPC
ncbi:ROK family protein, partial [Rhizobium leguminosarum]|uniref:ROK family protein n=1 Tax=Rhizobium leguminosarum TaxID=384 RepID=UPI003F94A07B